MSQRLLPEIKGKIIHLEGPDGSGKSTQALQLIEWLKQKGLDAVFGRQPGFTEIGEGARKLLFESSYVDDLTKRLLFAASHTSLINEIYRQRGQERIFIIDRYVPVSNLVFGTYGDGLDAEYIKSLNASDLLGQFPDLIIIYQVTEETMLKRINARAAEKGETNYYDYKDLAFKSRIRKGYEEIRDHLLAEEQKIIRYVSAEGTVEEVFQETLKVLTKVFEI